MSTNLELPLLPGSRGEMRAITPKTVYVVDDDEAVRDSLRALLESYGMAVRDQASGSEFLKKFRKDGPVCLVLDIHMPGMNGLELLELMDVQGIRIPVIAITGRGDAALREKLAHAGVTTVFDKPVDEDQLVNAIESAFAPGP